MGVKQGVVVGFDVIEMWRRHEEVVAIIAHLSLDIALLVAGVGVAEPHGESVMAPEP